MVAAILAFILVLLPFLFWYDTWFGRKLSDEKTEEYLNDGAKPRHAQHALVQIGERLARGDTSVRRWYPRILQLASSPTVELRQTAAWIMGQDTRYQPFHDALPGLLGDPVPLVRYNAALSLAAFRDPAARPELRAMLAEAPPREKQVWEALRALFLVGNTSDLDEVNRYARGVPGMSPSIQQQATLTAREISAR
jgi:hypothetical protein